MASDTSSSSSGEGGTYACFGLPGWTAAHRRIVELIPAAFHSIAGPIAMTPDNICAAAEDAGFPFKFALFPSRWREHLSEQRHWEDWSREEIYDAVFKPWPASPGELWFIPDECFVRGSEPYRVHGEELQSHILTREFFVFDGDVLFIWAQEARITVFHHEGGYAHIDCAQAGKR